jgi:autotransporter-associated beta strand protein
MLFSNSGGGHDHSQCLPACRVCRDVPIAHAGAQSITLGPDQSTLAEGGNYDMSSSNQIAEQGTYTGMGGTYTYSYANTSGSTLLLSPQTFAWYSAQQAKNVVTPYVVMVLNPDLEANNSQQVLAIGDTQTNHPPSTGGLQLAPFYAGSGNVFTLAPGQEIAIGFIDAKANGTGNTGNVESSAASFSPNFAATSGFAGITASSGGDIDMNVYYVLIENSQLPVITAGRATPTGGVPSTTKMAIASGGTWDLDGSAQTIASLSDNMPGSGGNVINSASGSTSILTLSPTGGSTTFSGMIQGGGTLGAIRFVLSGPGTLVLSGTNTYTGGTEVEAGTLIVNNSAALPDGTSLTIGAGGKFIFDSTQGGTPAVASMISPVPESGTLALLLAGLVVGVGLAGRKRNWI